MRKTISEITHNCRVKIYPDGSREILVASAAIFREPGWERADKWQPDIIDGCADEPRESVNDSLSRAKRRARCAVRDLALSNDFSYFVTLTLDQSKIDRYDISEVTKRLNRWLDNQVRRRGLRYVLVPERHRDGAIHFHGFINDALEVVDSGTLTGPGSGAKPRRPRSEAERRAALDAGAHIVYNVPNWAYGFTTAIRLYGERRAAVGYVCKYVTKAQEKIGGRWYYSGGALARPVVEFDDVEYSEFSDANPGGEFFVEGLGVSFVRKEVI